MQHATVGSRVKSRLLYARLSHLSRRDWRERYKKVLALNPKYAAPCDVAVEEAHKRLWGHLGPKVNPLTLRVCHGASGSADPAIVPEEIFDAVIERSLNRYAFAAFLQHKSGYNRWHPRGKFIPVLLHGVDGLLMDEHYEPISQEDLSHRIEHLDYPVVVKPNMDSSGGRNVFFPESTDELRRTIEEWKDFVVQPVARQSEFFDQFNRHGLNTVRACLYRSVVDNNVHLLNISLRMGKGGSLDNETAGGIVCCIHGDGHLHHYALDKYGVKFDRHPDTDITFADMPAIPDVEELRRLAIAVARDIFLTRLVSLDLYHDAREGWKLVEVNIFGQTIRFAQYAGVPFFGRFTDEVVEYCASNPWWK